MRLGIDFDGTITDAASMQRSYAARRWGIELSELQVMRGGAGPILGEYRYASMGKALWGPLTAFTPPQDGALPLLGQLIEDHEVTIVTARHSHAAAFARRWLASRGLEIAVVNTSGAPKTSICSRFGIELLLDDDVVRHGADLLEAGTLPVLFELPHNRHLERPTRMRAVDGWAAFADLVAELDRR